MLSLIKNSLRRVSLSGRARSESKFYVPPASDAHVEFGDLQHAASSTPQGVMAMLPRGRARRASQGDDDRPPGYHPGSNALVLGAPLRRPPLPALLGPEVMLEISTMGMPPSPQRAIAEGGGGKAAGGASSGSCGGLAPTVVPLQKSNLSRAMLKEIRAAPSEFDSLMSAGTAEAVGDGGESAAACAKQSPFSATAATDDGMLAVAQQQQQIQQAQLSAGPRVVLLTWHSLMHEGVDVELGGPTLGGDTIKPSK